MLSLVPLAMQEVAETDSVLGLYRNPGQQSTGLTTSYKQLIEDAFVQSWWDSDQLVDGQYTQMQANFSLFWGLAIQLYEATLVSDQTAFDLYAEGDNKALNRKEKFGLQVFLDINKGACILCHAGAEFTFVSVRSIACPPSGVGAALERMAMGNGVAALYDGGFYNIGVRPTFEDLAIGTELGGFPLSYSNQISEERVVDVFCSGGVPFEIDPNRPPGPDERTASEGAFKVPGLRNVALTAPYFHNGGQATLMQVVEFYDRGGDFGLLRLENSNIDNLDPLIAAIGFTSREEKALVAFLKALTDPRVDNEMAPFDHPSLAIPNGHIGDENNVTPYIGTLIATEDIEIIPAVGAEGRKPLGLLPLHKTGGFESRLDN
jgi:hypothetical protein